MKSHTVHLTMNVPARMDFVNITGEVEQAVARSGVREGLCLVNAMHITASVFINDDEPGARPPQPDGGGQRRRPPQAPGHGPGGGGGGDEGPTRLRPLGADLLRG